MNIFSNVRRKSLQEYINEARGREGSIFLDVRTPEEYRDGHVEGSLNLPLHELKKIETLIPDKTSPVYVYCRTSQWSHSDRR